MKLIGCFQILGELLIINQRDQKPLHHHLIMAERSAGSTRRILVEVFPPLSAACLCASIAETLVTCSSASLRPRQQVRITAGKTLLQHISHTQNHLSYTNCPIMTELLRIVCESFSLIKNSTFVLQKCRLFEGQDSSLHK